MKRLALALLFVAVAATAASAQDCALKSPMRSLGAQQLTISSTVVALSAPGSAVVTGVTAIPSNTLLAIAIVRANAVNIVSGGSTAPTTSSGAPYGSGYSQSFIMCGTQATVQLIRNGTNDATVDVEYFGL